MGEGKPEVGTVGWIDITSGRADELREFYREVVGWGVREVGMRGYSDYSMVAPGSGRDAAGVCHLRGANAAIPPDVWLPYFVVDSLARAVAAALARGGSVVVAERSAGGAARFSVVRDPAGAFAALFEAGAIRCEGLRAGLAVAGGTALPPTLASTPLPPGTPRERRQSRSLAHTTHPALQPPEPPRSGEVNSPSLIPGSPRPAGPGRARGPLGHSQRCRKEAS